MSIAQLRRLAPISAVSSGKGKEYPRCGATEEGCPTLRGRSSPFDIEDWQAALVSLFVRVLPQLDPIIGIAEAELSLYCRCLSFRLDEGSFTFMYSFASQFIVSLSSRINTSVVDPRKLPAYQKKAKDNVEVNLEHL